jgi:hypothetical protein
LLLDASRVGVAVLFLVQMQCFLQDHASLLVLADGSMGWPIFRGCRLIGRGR